MTKRSEKLGAINFVFKAAPAMSIAEVVRTKKAATELGDVNSPVTPARIAFSIEQSYREPTLREVEQHGGGIGGYIRAQSAIIREHLKANGE